MYRTIVIKIMANNINVGNVFLGMDKEYDSLMNIYEIIIKEIKDDKVEYDRKLIGFKDLNGIINNKKTTRIYIDESKKKVWKGEKTTITQMEKGVFHNVVLCKTEGCCIIL